jgi:uncharacterized protein YbdZ (MbtH family)
MNRYRLLLPSGVAWADHFSFWGWTFQTPEGWNTVVILIKNEIALSYVSRTVVILNS